MSRRLEDLSGPEIGERITESSVIIQPIGAVEQHGPHLPLSVDHVIAHEAAARVVEAAGNDLDLWLLPTLSVSKSDEHAWSPGTIWLSATTMLAVLDNIGRSVAATEAKRLVFLNAHGGNSALVGVACREIRRKYGLMTFLVHPIVPPDQGGASPESEKGMGIHGGHYETSVFMHLRPDLVNLELAERMVPDHLDENEFVRFGGITGFGWLSNDFNEYGYIGDPTKASPEEGETLFNSAIRILVEQMSEISGFSFGSD